MITITPKHWMFFACLLLSVVCLFFTLRVLMMDSERREFAIFILALAGCGAAWGMWAHVRTHARIEQLEERLDVQERAKKQALVLSAAARGGKAHLTSLD